MHNRHAARTFVRNSGLVLAAATALVLATAGWAHDERSSPAKIASTTANDPLKVVKALYAAFEKGDIPGIKGLLSPEVRWIYHGPETTLPFAGSRKGPDGVLDFFTRVDETLGDATATQDDFILAGDKVYVPGWEESTVKSTGEHYKVPNVHVFTVKGNRIVRFEEFIDSGTVSEAFYPGDAARGRAFYTSCAGCHGPAGEGNAGMHAPPLAGREEAYILRQLRHFRAGIRGQREDFYGYMMVARAGALPGDRGLRDVSAYVASLPRPPVAAAAVAPVQTVAAFESCKACHGENGEGNAALSAPAIGGLPDWYIRQQLTNFRKGLRGSAKGDEAGVQMRAALMALPESNDEASAKFASTLAPKSLR